MKTLIILLCIFVVGCSNAYNSNNYVVSGAPDEQGLYELSGTNFDSVRVESKSKLGSYSVVYFEPLNTTDLIIDDRRLHSSDKPWVFGSKEHERLSRMLSDITTKLFDASTGIALSMEPTPNSLTASIKLIKFTPSASKDEPRNRGIGDKIYTLSVGELKARVLLKDSTTGEIVGIINDSEEVGDSPWLERNDRPNNTREIRLTMSDWVRSLKSVLEAE